MNQRLKMVRHAAEALFYFTFAVTAVFSILGKWAIPPSFLAYGIVAISLWLFIKRIFSVFHSKNSQRQTLAITPIKAGPSGKKDADETLINNMEPLGLGQTNAIVTRPNMKDASIEPNAIEDLLSSIVYFMSRNFKAYSSLGFIFDPLGNVFTLNSIEKLGS